MASKQLREIRRKRSVTNNAHDETSSTNHQEQIRKIKNSLNLIEVSPKTITQNKAFKAFHEGQDLVLHGYAGTGKSFLGLYFGILDTIVNKNFDKLVLIRSAVEGRKIGHLPGDTGDKLAEYEAVFSDIFGVLFKNPKAYSLLKNQGKVEFHSTSFLRGKTFNDSFIFVDEINNMNMQELSTIMTRIGENSRIIFSGDYRQSDFQFNDEKAGIHDFMKITKKMDCFSFIEFNVNDIVRSKKVKSFILEASKLGLM